MKANRSAASERPNQVGDLIIMQKPQTSVWGSKNNSSAASERRFMVIHKYFFIFIIAILIAIPPIQARKIKTKHSIPKISVTNTSESSDSILSISSDSISFTEKILPAIRFYGFDKTVSSNFESFFITNNLNSEIREMEIEITYFDMKGRQLHKRNVKIDCNLPAGETKRTDIKSWDTQKSFYFHQSAKPRRQATPFDVKLRLLSLTLPPFR
ncbi:MAG: hypothetical protein K2K75_08975 [Muribaculaceae bacterium]|nr:hypothetical protein [Muribaculaceae bacterium]